MLRELVRERLIAAADEIFRLFERTIVSYEEQLSRAREETERHRRLLEGDCNNQIVMRNQDVQVLIGHQEEPSFQQKAVSSSLDWDDTQCPLVKEEKEERKTLRDEEEKDPEPAYVKKEEEGFDISKLPLTGVSMEDEADDDETLKRRGQSPSGNHCGGVTPDNLLAPLSDSDDDMEEQTAGAVPPMRRRKCRAYRAKSGVDAPLALSKSPVSDTTAAFHIAETPREKTQKSLEAQFFPPSHCDMDSERKRKVSAVWDHFDLVSSIKVKCRICSTELSYINKSTSSMLRHYRARHEQEEVTITPRITTASRKHALDQAVLNFIIKESQPLSIVESDAFRELLQALEPSYVLPTRKVCIENIQT
ncbi:uncharacterized protein LOC133499826 [Syngnathoides biaculeatus]|uniref:uncharacterized protein LOC133499826 n=1 Tax=Syngnathoides biaculeatus TaxID=300417 RepID=UPI002ADE2074|nr:uncharacterized protein LOC133499826 [Syngnathoides biaculeatus]